MRRTSWILDIPDRSPQKDELHTMYADLSNVAPDIFSIIPHGVIVEARFPLAEVLSAGASRTPQARHFAGQSL
jgi:hypothetical protein